jgi:hypothetical protein
MVRAKFRVISLTKYESGSDEIKLAPVSSGSEENKMFWKYSPSGSITLSCINSEATKQFEIGKEYYVDFNVAE